MVERHEYPPTGDMDPHNSLLLPDFRTQINDVSERNQCDDVCTHLRIEEKEEMAPPVALEC